MDDMFASMIAEDHDQNRNGTLEPDEVQSVKEFNFFTFIKIDNQAVQIKFIRDFNATLDNRKLAYEVLIPCHVGDHGYL